jgi:PAS domain S-box-containing protein
MNLPSHLPSGLASVASRPASPQRVRWLVLGSAVVTALLFAALGSYALVQSRWQYEQRAELLTQNLASATAGNLTAQIDRIDLALGAVVARLEQQLAEGRLDLAREAGHLRDQTVNRPELEGIRVTDPQGMAILGPGLSQNKALDFSDRAWFQAQRDHPDMGLYVSSPLQSKLNGQWIMSLSHRYRDATGAFAGVVSAALPLDYFNRLLAVPNVGPHGTVVLRDLDLRLVTRYPALPGDRGAIGNPAATPELRRHVQAPGWQTATYHSDHPPDGVARTYTAQRLGALPLLVVVGVASQDYLADWQRELQAVLAFSLAVVALYGAGCVLLLRLLAQNRAARQRIDLLAKVFDSSGEAILVTDSANRIVEVNPAFTRQTGYTAREIIGQDPKMLITEPTSPQEVAEIWRAVQRDGEWRGELWTLGKDGQVHPKWLSMAALRDPTGMVSHHIASLVDLTEVKQAEEEMALLNFKWVAGHEG